MQNICVSCGTVIQEGSHPISHGICFGCFVEACDHCGLEWREILEPELHPVEHGGEA